jgi:hypothetical protein
MFEVAPELAHTICAKYRWACSQIYLNNASSHAIDADIGVLGLPLQVLESFYISGVNLAISRSA